MGNGLRQINWNPAMPPYSNGPYNWSERITFDGEIGLSKERVTFTEDFKQIPLLNTNIGVVSNLDFELLGTNAANVNATYMTTAAGILLTTAGADNDQMIVLPHLDAKQTAWTGTLWGTENQVIWEAIIKLSAVTVIEIWAGLKLTNTGAIAADDDQVYFRFDTDSDTYWNCISSIGGTDTTTATEVVPTIADIVKFKISIDSDRKATFWINDEAQYTTAALTNDVDLIPYIGVQAKSAAATTLIVVREQISRIIYE